MNTSDPALHQEGVGTSDDAAHGGTPPCTGSAVRFSLDPESGFVRDHAAGEWLTTAEEVFDVLSPLLPNAAGEVRRNAVTSTGLLGLPGSGE